MKLRYHFSRQRRQLVHLGKQILRMQEAGKNIPAKLQARFQRLAAKLLPRFGSRGLQRALGGAALLLGLGVSAQAQVFADPVQNPFSLTATILGESYYNYPTFADLDGDGDLDMLVGVYNYDNEESTFAYYENNGTATTPLFAFPNNTPFGLVVQDVDAFSLQLVDVDGDGDLDVFTSGFGNTGPDYAATLTYQENIGSATNPEFGELQDDPFGFIPQGVSDNVVAFEFGDLDGDGDLDVITQLYDGIFNTEGFVSFYYENESDADGVSFAGGVQDPFGIDYTAPGGEIIQISDLADIDGDGDLDLLAGTLTETNDDSYQTNLTFLENTGTATEPAFAAPVFEAFGIISEDVDENFRFEMIDLDADGDLDLMSVNSEDGFLYYENVVDTEVAEVDASIQLTLAPNPTSGQINLLTSESVQRVEVLNVLGRQLLTLNNSNVIDLSAQPTGTYLIKVVTEDNRFIVKRVSKQ